MNVRRQPTQREAVELQLDSALMADAKALGLDAAALMEDALRENVEAAKTRRWRQENAEAIAADNALLDRDGLWCDAHRQF